MANRRPGKNVDWFPVPMPMSKLGFQAFSGISPCSSGTRKLRRTRARVCPQECKTRVYNFSRYFVFVNLTKIDRRRPICIDYGEYNAVRTSTSGINHVSSSVRVS